MPVTIRFGCVAAVVIIIIAIYLRTYVLRSISIVLMLHVKSHQSNTDSNEQCESLMIIKCAIQNVRMYSPNICIYDFKICHSRKGIAESAYLAKCSVQASGCAEFQTKLHRKQT